MRFGLVLLLSFIFFTSHDARAFVFYPLGDKVLKWNVNSPQVRPSTVNPTTQAIRYYIAEDTFTSANRMNEINAVRACFDQWQSISGSTVRFEFAGLISADGLDARYDNTNVVFWAKKSLKVNGGLQDLNGRRGWTSVTYAVDGSILDADIVLNGIQYQWFTDPNDTANQAQYIESIVLHEIGHFLGLDHTPAGGATVIDGGNGINTNAGLSADEIAAIRYLYDDGSVKRASIRGSVRLNGAGILGAVVVAEDSTGNIAGATVSQASGNYAIYSLPAGSYKLRVSPLDPASSGNNSLLRGDEIAPDYANAVTTFAPTANRNIVLQAGEAKVEDINVAAANSPIRITSISKPTVLSDVVSVVRYAVTVTQGQNDLFIGVSSPSFQQGATLSVTGNGVTVGPTTFLENRIAPGVHSLVVPISVSGNATPGLRTLVVSQNGSLAYANGYLEIASAVRDDNFDGLDDSFQRKYWKPWTSPEGAPTADPDNDGFSNRFEFRTNTDPADRSSNRLLLQQPARGRFGQVLAWESDMGKRYQVYGSSTLFPADWQPVGDVVTALGEVWSIPVTLSVPYRFYRLELKR